MSLYFVTSNENKLREARAVFPDIIQCAVDMPEIQELEDPHMLIRSKLLQAEQHVHARFIVEDQWLEFDSHHALPGPFIKWFERRLGNEGLYGMVEKYGTFTAHNRVIVGYQGELGDPHVFEAIVDGVIVSPRGNMDFGWAPIFQPAGSKKTYAEMLPEEKASYNPRAHALKKLKDFLESNK